MPNHIEWPQLAGNYASTPDTAVFPTGDAWFEVKVDMADWNVDTHVFQAKADSGTNRSYQVYITGGLLLFGRTENGTDWYFTGGSYLNVDTIPIPDGDIAWIRFIFDADGGTGGKALITLRWVVLLVLFTTVLLRR
jgi:hypothetical protein